MPVEAVKRLLRLEAAPGILLVAGAVLALLLDNSPIKWLYDGLLTTPVAVQVGALDRIGSHPGAERCPAVLCAGLFGHARAR